MKHGKTLGSALAVGGVFIVLGVGFMAFNGAGIAQSPDPNNADARGFATMAVAPDKPTECKEPKAPSELGIVPLQNAYAQIARIMALEKAKAAGSCDCPYGTVDWGAVVKASPEFERSDGAEIRFDNVKLRLRADAEEAKLNLSCAK